MSSTKKKELRVIIINEILNLFSGWDMCDIATIEETIIDDVIEDLLETSNYPCFNNSDIRISIKRVLISKLK